tara:strand:- start:44 stop:298 length:255 start_codon:yes stop_codon:yes gene_type:complete
MQLTDYQLNHLVSLVRTDINGLLSTIDDYKQIIKDSKKKKENPKFIKICENTLNGFEKSLDERTNLLQKLQIKANKQSYFNLKK